jgi:drug/metabolite transporter (DMT)-like permease
MAIELLANRNMSEGLHVLFVYINDVTHGLFIRLTLFSIFMIILMGLYMNQKRSTGTGDFPASFSVAGFITLIVSVLLRLIEGLVDGYSFAVVIIISVIGVLWLLFGRKEQV